MGHVLTLEADGSGMMGVPTYYTRLLAQSQLDRASCGAMRLFISGSALLLAEPFAAFEQPTGHRILERYGMTQTGMNTSHPLGGGQLQVTASRGLMASFQARRGRCGGFI